MTVTDCADAHSAPATVVADLGRWPKIFPYEQHTKTARCFDDYRGCRYDRFVDGAAGSEGGSSCDFEFDADRVLAGGGFLALVVFCRVASRTERKPGAALRLVGDSPISGGALRLCEVHQGPV